MRLRRAHTLLELVVVLAIMIALAGLLVPLFSGVVQDAQRVTTERSLITVRDAICEYWRDTKHIPLDGISSVADESNRLSVQWLFTNPKTGDQTNDFSIQTLIGWRGPYLAAATGSQIPVVTPSLIDAWDNQLAIHDVDHTASLRDVRIVSAGPNGSIDIPSAIATDALTTGDIGDDVYVSLHLQ